MDEVNQIIFHYWNLRISQEKMQEQLSNIPIDELTEWITEISNRIPEVMAFVRRSQYPA